MNFVGMCHDTLQQRSRRTGTVDSHGRFHRTHMVPQKSVHAVAKRWCVLQLAGHRHGDSGFYSKPRPEVARVEQHCFSYSFKVDEVSKYVWLRSKCRQVAEKVGRIRNERRDMLNQVWWKLHRGVAVTWPVDSLLLCHGASLATLDNKRSGTPSHASICRPRAYQHSTSLSVQCRDAIGLLELDRLLGQQEELEEVVPSRPSPSVCA
ncbi:hypothetical protein H310_14438 [Aphanomyces invadans]|uniref:Uncharacterized protein n=1 Tax=Aphanomyces invadans TaxID=157072 RepID=A0A024T9W9_9STRA|nr:hypothetical protein H310_14438 [Aphanomyces invadans]ETV90843.1 hypothetical protein H310_14438 [Aphanomyces invadans]|eukprot:XP_008880521.1 hypothetical protein H310_14438 [Aphanomyces invadans]